MHSSTEYFGPSDGIPVHSHNDQIYYSILVLGIIAAGGIYMGTNPSYTSHELGYHLRAAQVKFVISEPEMLDRMIPAAEGNGIPQDRIWAFTTRESQVPATTGLAPWTALLKHGEADWRRLNDPSQAKTTVVARLFSSGTTGLPKPVDFTHYNLIAQHTLVYDAHPVPFEVRTPPSHPQVAYNPHLTTTRHAESSICPSSTPPQPHPHTSASSVLAIHPTSFAASSQTSS